MTGNRGVVKTVKENKVISDLTIEAFWTGGRYRVSIRNYFYCIKIKFTQIENRYKLKYSRH